MSKPLDLRSVSTPAWSNQSDSVHPKSAHNTASLSETRLFSPLECSGAGKDPTMPDPAGRTVEGSGISETGVERADSAGGL